MNDFICSLLITIITATIVSIMWISEINQSYSKIITNKTTNNLYIEYKNNLYKLIPIE